MLLYLLVNIIIIFFGFLYEIINSKERNSSNKKSNLIVLIFIIPSFILLFILSSFRGEFTTDYDAYVNLFNYYNQFSWLDIFYLDIYQEIGYVFLNKTIGVFTTNELYLFIFTSLIILLCFYTQFKKYSPYIWISVLLFVTIGSFYASFNITRQILAAAIIFAGSQYLFERKMGKYILTVFLAALFHRTALIMIIFFFILNNRFKLKNIIVIFFIAIISMLYIGNIIDYIQTYFYTEYKVDSYGMSGLKYTNIVLPISILIFVMFHFKKINLENLKYKISVNAIIFYAFFSILGLKVMMIERLSHFFAPYALLIIPIIISQIKSKELRGMYIMALIIFCILYNYLVLRDTGYDPYYLIFK
ncbi:EpsG family protein [Planococcus salinus]|uniref:EpsG family protein n=1 Tax=Planococcus salinus TaxID=1848460 RepID=A0A3M8P7H8_9BACL|nr:EpsG family protein [Planococcus salinus]RNF39623.1 EpsG family protein [Planococcus salinus]